MNTYSSSDLATLGELLHDDGIEAHLDDLGRVVASAEVWGVAPDIRSTVLDPHVSAILRLRAFSVLARELTRDHMTVATTNRPVRATRRRAVNRHTTRATARRLPTVTGVS
jgi:hypothetical protein